MRTLGAPKGPTWSSPPHPTPPSPAGVTSGNSNSPSSLPSSQVSLPPVVDSPTGRRQPRGGGPGAGEAGPGAALTSSTVSGMQIRYSFSNMVLPAADLGAESEGHPPEQQSCRPGAGQGARSPTLGAGGRIRSGGGAQLLASSSQPETMSRFGSGYSRLPASFLAEVGPPGTQCCKVRAGGSPAGDLSDPQPRAVGAAVRSGHARWRAREEKKRDFRKLKRMHKSHPLDLPLKPNMNLPTPFPGRSAQSSFTRNTSQPEMLTFQTKARRAPLPRR